VAGVPDKIPANAVLTFEVELLNVADKKSKISDVH
jgi:FKBP-type peptidyl-prolyl cis-trans isomerase